MSEIDFLSNKLETFVPRSACIEIAEMLVSENVKLTITKKRKTKLGDYRAPSQRIGYHKISINGDLNTYMFLLVLLHEFAHLYTWKDHQHKVKAHGEEWKAYYKGLVDQFSSSFPKEVFEIIEKHFANLKATTCNDPYLTKHLMHMDSKEDVLLLHDLEPGELFETNGRSFQMLNKRRTRFLCQDMLNKKNYLVSGSALVTRLNK